MRMSSRWVFSLPDVLKLTRFTPGTWITVCLPAFLSSTAAHVWSWRCGCERLEREHQVQEQLLLQPRRYPVVLESKTIFHAWSQEAELFFFFKSFVLVIYLLFISFCVIIDSAVDGCRKENPALTVCDGNIKGPDEWLCWTLWWDNLLRFLLLPTALLVESGFLL